MVGGFKTVTTARVGNFRRGRFLAGRVVPALAVSAGVILGGCASTPPPPDSDGTASLAVLEHVEDRRGRFREIFCAIL